MKILLFSLLLASEATVYSAQQLGDITVVTKGEPRLILRSQECGPEDVPDAGLRVFRRQDGSIYGFASGYDNFPIAGQALSDLHRVCKSAYQSEHNANPESFDDETWLAATWTDNGRDIMAIGHNEYHGEQHPGACHGTSPRVCRYGVLLHLTSHDGGSTFTKTTSSPLVAPPIRQEVDQQRDTGFFQPSNIFEHDGWKYVFVRTSGGGSQKAATCLMRSDKPESPASWGIYDGSAFRPALFNPYADDVVSRPSCAPLANINGLVWTVVQLRGTDFLIALLTRVDSRTNITRLMTSTSRDALHWSAPRIVQGINLEWSESCPTSPYLHYPSLVDPQSSRRNFDDVGTSALLFFTSIEVSHCKFTMHRDLIAQPVQILIGPAP